MPTQDPFQLWLDPIRIEAHSDFLYREFRSSDCPVQLTRLLQTAYGDVAARTGVRYWASYGDVATTVQRIAKGETFVALFGTEPIGTLTLYRPEESVGSAWYERSEVTSFGLFAVLPSCQGLGVGKQLVRIAEKRAREWGMKELALDTAERLADSVRMYERMGYRAIENVRWSHDDFESRILSKKL